MKYLFTFFLLCFFLKSKSQEKTTYTTEYNNGLCSGAIILYPDKTYVYEYGCESSSHLSFGNWAKKKDTVKLQPVNPKIYAVVKTVDASAIPGDSIWLTILDKDGVNMTAKISTGLEIAGRGSYMFSPDSSENKKFVFKREGGRIVFRTLNKLFGQRIELPTGTNNNFIVTLNLASDWISSTHADWGGSNNFLLTEKGNMLFTVDRFPEQRIFKKEAK